MKVPKVKKNLSSFLLEEDGKVTCQSILALGAILAGAALAGISLDSVKADSGGVSSKVADWDSQGVFRGTTENPGSSQHPFLTKVENSTHLSHSSHGSHGSHASHASHGSHASHASHGSHASHASY